MLIRAVDCLGKDWSRISEFLDKPAKEVRYRYINRLDPSINIGRWTEEEDQMLVALVDKDIRDPDQLAQYFPTRTPESIKRRYYKKVRPVLKVNTVDTNRQIVTDLR